VLFCRPEADRIGGRRERHEFGGEIWCYFTDLRLIVSVAEGKDLCLEMRFNVILRTWSWGGRKERHGLGCKISCYLAIMFRKSMRSVVYLQ
jgi:hypothetical protein